jgi:hypothetical protein
MVTTFRLTVTIIGFRGSTSSLLGTITVILFVAGALADVTANLQHTLISLNMATHTLGSDAIKLLSVIGDDLGDALFKLDILIQRVDL